MAEKRAKRSEESKSVVMTEMRQRFTRSVSWEATARRRFIDDIKFREGDADNLYQWPEDIRSRMDQETRAMLTINEVAQHCFQITNYAAQSKIAIRVRPTGGGSSFDSAQIFEGIIRHIEYQSQAGDAYQNALDFAVGGGIGYWRVTTDYANDDSFDQEIFIRPIRDPLLVYLDTDIHQFDASDMNYAFVFIDMPKEEFERKYPEWKGRAANADLGPDSWYRQDGIRIAEYWRRTETKDRLLGYPDPEDPTGKTMKEVRESDLEPGLAKALMKLPTTMSRPIKSHKVEWFKIIGDEIVDEKEWCGDTIPIVRCVGRETVLDGEMDRKGHVRALKDGQRMLNYNASGSVEFGALQSKTPYLAPADAIEGFEDYWNNINTTNFSVVPWNHRDDEGQEIPEPKRQQPPMGAPLFMQGMKDASEWMRAASGQWQSEMGAPSNEKSGVAINARQRQGDNATFHFLDHQSIAIRYTGRILKGIIPKVYDTERVMKILDEGGTTETQIRIDPQAQQALQKMDRTRTEVAAIFNPNVGKYEVEADVGPAYETQRQEAFEAYTQILSENKELASVIGDIALSYADFPGAQEASQRLKRMVPAQALQDGPAPDVIAAQKKIQMMEQLIQKLAEKLADKTASHLNNQEKNAIHAYDSQTKRLGAIKDWLSQDPEGLLKLVKEVISEADSTSMAGLSPSLMPTQELNAENSGPLAPPAQLALASPGGPPPVSPAAPLAAGGGLPPQDSPQDMGAGPAPTPGSAPTGMR